MTAEPTILTCRRCDEDFAPIPASARHCMTCRELMALPKALRQKRQRQWREVA